MSMTTADVIDGEATEIGAALALVEPMGVSLARVEIDTQIATARRYPRSIVRAAKNIQSLVTLDRDAAEECMYALPRGGKPIQGPSIRLAEIIFQCWGNARCDARVVGVDRVEKVVIAEGIYHDLETNSAGRATVRRSIADKHGRIFKDDMIAVTGNAACSIAKRNAILAVVPKTVWNRAYMDAREVVAGTLSTLGVSRQKAIAAFANFGVKPEQIFPAIGVAGLEEITLDHIPVLRGMFSALKNGEATVEEMFGSNRAASNHVKVADPLKDDAPEKTKDRASREPAPDATNWPLEIESYRNRLGECETEDSLAEAIESYGPVFDDAPADVQSKVCAAESDRRSNIVDRTEDDRTPTDPREAVLHELRSAITNGEKRVSFLLQDLSAERRALVTEDDRKALVAMQKGIEADRNGSAGK